MASNLPIIGNYRLVKEIASGGFGRVYFAEHLHFANRKAAIKLLHAHLPTGEQEKFLKEAQILEMLKHEHILPIIDVGIQNGVAYMITEFAPGGSLGDLLKRHGARPLPPEEAMRILTQTAEALQFAHQHNIIHRDLKPENILFHADGRILLADFGISTVLSTMSMQSGTVIGTPSYMSPEQFQGKVSKESDQYALGCIAYELLTGQRVFTAPDMFALGMKHFSEIPQPPDSLNKSIPAFVSQAIMKALAKDRGQRYGNVMDFIQAMKLTVKKFSAKDYVDQGRILSDQKRYGEALEVYEQALRLAPQDAHAYYNKGNALSDQKRYGEALNAYEQALRLDPLDVGAYDSKGEALFMLERYAESLIAYEQALRIDPQYARAYNNKGQVLQVLGRDREAQVAFNRAKQLGFSADE